LFRIIKPVELLSANLFLQMGNAGVTVYNSTKYPMNIYLSLGAIHHFCNRVKPKEAFTIYPGPILYTVGCFLSIETNDITNTQCLTQISCIAIPIALGTATAGLGLAAGLGSGGAASIGASLPGFATVLAIGESVFGTALTTLGSAVAAVVAEAIAIGTATAVGAGGTALVTKALLENFKQAADKTNWQDNIKGIYCGGDHKILIIEGGPYIENNLWYPHNISIKESNASKIPSDANYRMKNGLYNDDYDYWDNPKSEWYPPNNFPK